MLMIELYDSSRKYVSGIAEITGKDGGMNLFEVNIYLNASFNPKTILVKTLEIPINRLKFHSIIYNASFIFCHSLALVQSTSRHYTIDIKLLRTYQRKNKGMDAICYGDYHISKCIAYCSVYINTNHIFSFFWFECLCKFCNISLEFYNGDFGASVSSISMNFRITNNGSSQISLRTLN